MNVLAAFGFFQPKSIPALKLIPLAMGFVGYIVLCNLSLNINSVGFYQVGHLRSSCKSQFIFLHLSFTWRRALWATHVCNLSLNINSMGLLSGEAPAQLL